MLSTMPPVLRKKSNILFLILGGFFITNALVAEFIGVKIFSFEATLGIEPLAWDFMGALRSLDLTAGVLLWPIVFIMTDLINEYYGRKGVQFLSYLTVGLIIYAFVMVFMAISLVPSSWWVGNYSAQGVPNMQQAFQAVFGQGLWIIVGSLIAFLVGQIIDAAVFQRIRAYTGEKRLWLRATGSTAVSQLIDSYVVLYVAFVLGSNWSIEQFVAIGTVNYLYKFIVAIVLTPLLYSIHFLIDKFLGEEADILKTQASPGK